MLGRLYAKLNHLTPENEAITRLIAWLHTAFAELNADKSIEPADKITSLHSWRLHKPEQTQQFCINATTLSTFSFPLLAAYLKQYDLLQDLVKLMRSLCDMGHAARVFELLSQSHGEREYSFVPYLISSNNSHLIERYLNLLEYIYDYGGATLANIASLFHRESQCTNTTPWQQLQKNFHAKHIQFYFASYTHLLFPDSIYGQCWQIVHATGQSKFNWHEAANIGAIHARLSILLATALPFEALSIRWQGWHLGMTVTKLGDTQLLWLYLERLAQNYNVLCKRYLQSEAIPLLLQSFVKDESFWSLLARYHSPDTVVEVTSTYSHWLTWLATEGLCQGSAPLAESVGLAAKLQ